MQRVPKELKANVRFRRAVREYGAKSRRHARSVMKLCEEDVLFYVNTFVYAHVPGPMIEKVNVEMPFITWPFQDKAMLALADAVEKGYDLLVEKSRDMGGTWMMLMLFHWRWMFRKYEVLGLASRNEDCVDKRGDPNSLFWKLDFMTSRLPGWMKPEVNGHHLVRVNERTGSTLKGESTTGELFRGGKFACIGFDEFAALSLDDGFRALDASQGATACRIWNSTPKGPRNAFAQQAHSASTAKLTLHWTSHPLKNRGLYTSKDGVLVLKDKSFKGLVLRIVEKKPYWFMFPDDYPFILDGKTRSPFYDLECDRVTDLRRIAQEQDIDYLGSARQFFDAALIGRLRKETACEPFALGELKYRPADARPERFEPRAQGRLRLWMNLPANGRPLASRDYAIGVDVSQGTGASQSCIAVIDAGTGRKVAEWTDAHTTPKPLAVLAVALARYFNDAFLIWESQGPGQSFANAVRALGYGNIFYRRDETSDDPKITNKPGWFPSSKSKLALLLAYQEAMREGQCIECSEATLEECEYFVQKGDTVVFSGDTVGGQASHGDRAIASALAWRAVGEIGSNIMSEEIEAPVGSFRWREEQAAKKQTQGSFWNRGR